MKEQLTITTERVDDIVLLVAHMQRMGLDSLLDKHIPTYGLGTRARNFTSTFMSTCPILSSSDVYSNIAYPLSSIAK